MKTNSIKYWLIFKRFNPSGRLIIYFINNSSGRSVGDI